MDPLAIGTYNPTAASLPQIMSNTDMLMAPMLQEYSNRVAQLDDMDMTYPRATYPTQGAGAGSVFNYDEYYAQMAANQARMSQYQLEQATRARQDNLIASAPMERIGTTAMMLQEKIAQNEQDQIPAALQAFKQAVREAYDPEGTADDETITARALNIYQQQTGRSLLADIRENGHGDFMHGFLNSALFGLFGQNNSTEDTISEITGQPKSSQAQKMEKAGKVAGGVAMGAAAGAVAAIWGGPICAAIGGVVGAIYGFFK